MKLGKAKFRLSTRLSSGQILTLGFAALILLGALLLMLPISSNPGAEAVTFDKALFTSTSATCVTGLIVYDTYTQFSHFGQAVILLLIQIGGLGFMTVGLLFSLILRKKVGLRQRTILMDSVSTTRIGGVVELCRHALIGTAIVESAGALLLAIRFVPRYGAEGIWFAVFHSVSAFCNAGFDLMGKDAPFSSLAAFSSDPLVMITVMLLILIGGIGFLVWVDFTEKKFRFSRYSLQSKITLLFSAFLILLPAAAYFFTESGAAFRDMGTGEKILASFFSAVTPRTAGFGAADFASYSDGGTLMTVFLMFIGGGVGSTAGGLKITTFAVLTLTLLASIRGESTVSIFGRRLEDGAPRQALSSLGAYMSISLGGIFVVCLCGAPFKEAFFECVSAVSTVGLSMGMTPSLPLIAHIALILMMFSGRVGTISVAMALSEKPSSSSLKYPTEKVTIG